MTIAFTRHAWEDYVHWQGNDPETLERINDLILEITREPFKGKGKPEPLKGKLAGYWSRRITGEHRLVYFVSGIKPNHTLTIIQAKYHY